MRFQHRNFLVILLLVAATIAAVAGTMLANFHAAMGHAVRAGSTSADEALSRQHLQYAHRITGMVAQALADPMARGDLDTLARVADAARADPDLLRICVYDQSGAVVHDERPGTLGMPVSRAWPGAPSPPGPDFAEADGTLLVSAPVHSDGNVLGGVTAGFPMSGIREESASLAKELASLHRETMGDLYVWLISATILLLAAAAGLAYLLSRHMAEPLSTLTHATERIGRGEYDTDISVHRDDEIGDLADSFRKMARNLAVVNASLLEEIKERRSAERTMRKFRFIADTAADAMSMIGADYSFAAVNAAYCRNHGTEADDILGKTLAEVWGVEVFEEHIRPALDRCLAGERVRYEAWFSFADNPSGYYAVDYFPFRNAGGDVTHAVVISRDISARKKAEDDLLKARRRLENRVAERTAELEEANQDLAREVEEHRKARAELDSARLSAEAASRAKSAFLANMSHEVRTPLNGIIGMAELGLESAGDDDQRHIISTIANEARALLAVVNGILDYSKIEAGRFALESIPFDLHYLMEDVAASTSLIARHKGLEAVFYTPRDIPSKYVGDPGRLRQVLMNLVGNAVKFTEKGEVSVRVEPGEETDDGVRLRFTVRDTGIGIAPEMQERIFDSFTQADGSTSRRYGGTGLGTTIAREFVGMMDGEIGVESEPGKGSTFWFTVMLEKRKEATDGAEDEDLDLAGLRVLLVDDNLTSRLTIEEYMRGWGCICHGAGSGAEALDMLAEMVVRGARPELLICDIHMPVMTGFELAEAIRNSPELPHVPIILLTTHGNPGDGRKCRDLGIEGYLPKPIGHDDLRTAVRSVITASREGEGEMDGLVTRHTLAEVHRKKLRILVAEDYPTSRRVAQKHLASAGYQVDVVDDGRQAVDAFASRHYDLVLMDVQMPVLDGYEATREIRALEAERAGEPEAVTGVPVIAMTAHVSHGEKDQCLDAGMNDHIGKPLGKRELLDLVERWTGLDRVTEPDGWLPAAGLRATDAPALSADSAQRADESSILWDRALREFDGDENFLVEVLLGFLENATAQTGLLRRAIGEGNASLVQKEAHSMKGGAGNLRAERLAGLARALERMGMDENLDGADDVLDKLERELDRVVAVAREKGQGLS
ncbi:MAG: response regulator [Desulfatibacillaceae bacterium]